TWPWRTERTRTFWVESSDAVRQARSDPDHDRGARGLGEARLPGSPALAGGVLQTGNRSRSARPRGDRSVERDRLEGAALGVLEVLRSAAPDGQAVEPQAGAQGVLPDEAEPEAAHQAAAADAAAATVDGNPGDQRGVGAGLHARHALQRAHVPNAQDR